jgi:hypothetical protein
LSNEAMVYCPGQQDPDDINSFIYCNDHGHCNETSSVCICDDGWESDPNLSESLSCCEIVDDGNGLCQLLPMWLLLVAGCGGILLVTMLATIVAQRLGSPAVLLEAAAWIRHKVLKVPDSSPASSDDVSVDAVSTKPGDPVHEVPSKNLSAIGRLKVAYSLVMSMWASIAAVFWTDSSFSFIPLILEMSLLSINAAKRDGGYFPECWYNKVHPVIYGRTLAQPSPRAGDPGNRCSGKEALWYQLYFSATYVRIVIWFLLLSEEGWKSVSPSSDRCMNVFTLLSLAKTLGPQLAMFLDAAFFWYNSIFNKGERVNGACSMHEGPLKALEARWFGLRFYPIVQNKFGTDLVEKLCHIVCLLVVTNGAGDILWGLCKGASETSFWMDVWVWAPVAGSAICASAGMGLFAGVILAGLGGGGGGEERPSLGKPLITEQE